MLGSTTKMLFITAGMGGGTGTGASPIIAQAAKELDILTVAIITTPFSFEGKRRKMQADDGLDELKKYVDSYLVISNDRLREIFGNLTLGSAFAQADDILTTAAKGIAEIITVPGYINVDFKDVRTVMKDSGVSIMGSFAAEGENRALSAVEGALASPLLKDNEIEGARYILLNISSGLREVTMDEVAIITDFIQDKAGLSADLIWGNCIDETLGEKLSVTIIATGFQTTEQREKDRQNVKKISLLTPETAPLVKPIEPINSFIENVKEPEPEITEPVLKSQLDKQSDLFGDLFNLNHNTVAEAVENERIPHQFVVQEDFSDESQQEAAFEFEVKVSETEFVFETQLPEIEDHFVAEPVESIQVPGLDDDKDDDSIEDQLKKSKERILRLKDLSMKLRTSNGLQELENEPAYKRKQMQLQQVQHSSESQVSRFTLSNDEDGSTEIRPNNSFLHDNVD
jgi:cell division protein FtsZ